MTDLDPPAETGEPKKQSPTSLWMGLGIVALLAVCCGGAYLKGQKPDPEAAPRDAERVCQDFVKKRLKAPATADFSGLSAADDGDEYTVTGDVDSENSFGAKLRSSFTCVVRDQGETWKLVSITGLN